MEDHHRFYLVDWKSICRPLGCGGLGVRFIRDHNRVLLVKWLWRFRVEKESLWHEVVVARFGEISCWEAKEVRVWHGCGIWKSIQKVQDSFWNFIWFNLGSDREICFGEDRWIREFPLKVSFQNLYSLAVDLKGRVVDSFNEAGNICRSCFIEI